MTSSVGKAGRHVLPFHMLAVFLEFWVFPYLHVVIPGGLSLHVITKFFTLWQVIVTMLFFVAAIARDLTVSKSTRNSFTLAVHILYITLFSLAFTMTVATSLIFWSIYLYKPSLILGHAIPALLNHVMHTTPALFILLEPWLNPAPFRDSRARMVRDCAVVTLLGVVYCSLMVWGFLVGGRFPYPFLTKMGLSLALCFVSCVFLLAFMLIWLSGSYRKWVYVCCSCGEKKELQQQEKKKESLDDKVKQN